MAPAVGPEVGRVVGLGGLEPPTPRLSSVCSNQLSYRPPSAFSLLLLASLQSRSPSSCTPRTLRRLARSRLAKIKIARHNCLLFQAFLYFFTRSSRVMNVRA